MAFSDPQNLGIIFCPQDQHMHGLSPFDFIAFEPMHICVIPAEEHGGRALLTWNHTCESINSCCPKATFSHITWLQTWWSLSTHFILSTCWRCLQCSTHVGGHLKCKGAGTGENLMSEFRNDQHHHSSWKYCPLTGSPPLERWIHLLLTGGSLSQCAAEARVTVLLLHHLSMMQPSLRTCEQLWLR